VVLKYQTKLSHFQFETHNKYVPFTTKLCRKSAKERWLSTAPAGWTDTSERRRRGGWRHIILVHGRTLVNA